MAQSKVTPVRRETKDIWIMIGIFFGFLPVIHVSVLASISLGQPSIFWELVVYTALFPGGLCGMTWLCLSVSPIAGKQYSHQIFAGVLHAVVVLLISLGVLPQVVPEITYELSETTSSVGRFLITFLSILIAIYMAKAISSHVW